MWHELHCGAGVLVLVATGSAQELLYSRSGLPTQQYLGAHADHIGDVDGDGFQDFAIVNLQAHPVPGCSQDCEIEFVSGRDGHVIRRRQGSNSFQGCFFKPRYTGDVDGDGQLDYAVGVYDAVTTLSTIQICRASDDHVLWSVTRPWFSNEFGAAVLSGLDLDGDQRPDLVVGARFTAGPDPVFRGSYIAYSSTGRLLYEIFSDRFLAWYMALGIEKNADRVGDLDGDGCDDFIVGATSMPSPTGIPGVALISGRTGSVIRFSGGDLGEGLGYCVAALGDQDGDGVRDYAAGNGGDSFVLYGIVRAFSGRTGARIASWFEPRRTQYFGEVILGGMDADRDGIDDVWISSSEELLAGGAGVLRCFSGRDGRVLFVIPRLGSCGRYFLLGLGPQPDHPFPSFVVVNTCGFASPTGCPSRSGIVYLFRSNPPGVTPLGDACVGTLSQRPMLGLYQRDGAGLRFSISGAPATSLAGIFLGFSSSRLGALSLPHPLDPYGFPGCSLFTSSEYAFTLVAGTSGQAQGYAFLDLPEPYQGSSVPGLVVHAQGIVLDPRGSPGATTDALSLVYR